LGDIVEDTVCWGHVTGVEEINHLPFADNWEGTADIEDTSDAERVAIDSGEYLQTIDFVHTGTETVTILKNKYGTGDAGVVLKYRHGATIEDTSVAEWLTYSGPFASLGYVQVRIEHS
jgi:hypothetical protein